MLNLTLLEEKLSVSQKKWAGVLAVSMTVTLLGAFNALQGGANYWLGWTVAAFFAPGVCIALIKICHPRPQTCQRDGFVIRKSAWAAISYMVLCAGWFLGLMYAGVMRPDALWIIVPLMFMCALGVLAALWQFFDPRPITVINEKGFYDRNLRVGTIPWSEVAGASVAVVQGTEVICLKVKNPDLLAQKESMEKVLSWLDQVVGYELLHLGLVKLDAEHIDQALDYILARCEAGSAGPDNKPADSPLGALMSLACPGASDLPGQPDMP